MARASAQKWAAEIQNEAKDSANFSAIVPGRFKTMQGEGLVIYTEALVDGGQRLEGVFARHIRDDGVSVLSAESAVHSFEEEVDSLFIVFKNFL